MTRDIASSIIEFDLYEDGSHSIPLTKGKLSCPKLVVHGNLTSTDKYPKDLFKSQTMH